MKARHTPTPWVAIGRAIGTGTSAVATTHGQTTVKSYANAAFIVRAVNAHDSLLVELTEARAFIADELRSREDSFCGLDGTLPTDEVELSLVTKARELITAIDVALALAKPSPERTPGP